MVTFADLKLAQPIQRALEEKGYSVPTPIQQEAIPFLLEGRDLLGLAQTGTGKTAAFALPILHHLHTRPAKPIARSPRVLVLAPTRELASQIDESFRLYAKHMKLKHAVIFGGVGQGRQVDAMRGGVDVLTAAPGRLLDLIGQRHIDLSSLEILVLDEADRMLDMGFVHDIKRIMALLPPKRQTLLFSATMPDAISDLTRSLLNDPATVTVTPPSSTVDRIQQVVLFVNSENKKALTLELVANEKVKSAMVFTLMKHEANKVAEFLTKNGVVAEAIHGNKSQGARERAMSGFRAGRVKVLVATDIASRGIDVDDVTHVINYDLPNVAESYVHRIGRTARAGREGCAVALCDAEQRAWLNDIEKLIGKSLTVVDQHKFHSEEARLSRQKPPVLGGGGRRGGGRPGAGRPGGSSPSNRSRNNAGAPARPNGNRRTGSAPRRGPQR